MNKVIKTYSFSLVLFIFSSIFFLILRTGINADTWFHIKAGQYFLQHGISTRDVFSFSATGRKWFAYEWFFQVVLFVWQERFGLESLAIFTALFSTIALGIVYVSLRRVFRLHWFLCIWIVLFYYLFSIEFFTTRPQLFAIIFFLCNLGLILYYVYKGKNLLYISIPITILWANTHGSIILDLYLFTAYTILAYVQKFYALSKIKPQWKTLGFYTLLTIIASILPPLGISQYKLLYLFWQYHARLTFLSEWRSILDNYSPIQLTVFLAIIVSIIALTVLLTVKKKLFYQTIWFLPLSIFLILPFFAYRNIIYTYSIISLVTGYLLSYIPWLPTRNLLRISFLSFFSGTLMFFLYILFVARSTVTPSYTPIQAVSFIKAHPIYGNMFNELGDGGYILYALYPEEKVFIDLRFDLYACCELPIYETLLSHANETNQQFGPLVSKLLLDKYHISFAIINTQKGTLSERIGQFLQNDTKWDLVYWDDKSEIFIKKDGKNNALLQKFGTQVATPYGLIPFVPGKEQEALKEYQRMISITDSARSRNVLGYLAILQKKYIDAQDDFERAIVLDPTYGPAYANLAEMYLRNDDSETGISLYESAAKADPTTAYNYLRLAQLYIQYQQDSQKATTILEKGLNHMKNVQDQRSIEAAIFQINNLGIR